MLLLLRASAGMAANTTTLALATCTRPLATAFTAAAGSQPPAHQHLQQQSRLFSSSGGGGSSQEQQPLQPREGVPPGLAKMFVTGKLSQEELWLAGIPGKIKIWAARSRPELKGRENDVVEEVRSEFLDLMTRHATGRVLSHQARRQLKLACLAAATWDVLMRETGGNADAVDEHIAQSMGSIYAPFLLGSLKAVSWIKRAVFNESPYKQSLTTLQDISKDMEGACDCTIKEEEPGHLAALTTTSCIFHEVLSAEGKPQLLQHLCCQHNFKWLAAYEQHGVVAALPACRARGDCECKITVQASSGGGGGSNA